MKRLTLFALVLSAAPLAALAMPTVGDLIGTNAQDAAAALTAAGCSDAKFDAEGGKIEAKCIEIATGEMWEVYIDPQTGLVADLKQGD